MAVLNNAQEEQLREIGTHLQKLRQQQSISIEQVAAKTCIRLRMLKALEEGKLDDLPEPIYIQGFIRRYGDFLGLDGNALAKTFSTDYPPVEFDAQAILGNSTAKKADLEISEPNIIEDPSEPPEIDTPAAPPPAKTIPPYLAYIILGVAALVSLVYAFNKPRTPESAAQKQQPISQPVSASPVTSSPNPIASTSISKSPTVSPTELAIQPSPTASPTELAIQPSTTDTPAINTSGVLPIQVTLNIQDESWVRVTADGKTLFEGILHKGMQQSFSAEKQLTIRSGNAGAVLVSVNQKEAQPLGKLGAVKQVTFTPEQ
ncbi:RodZ domain-containing protein [Microseira sp. BLCC-F43]|uniref:helix-turn-helix domain-containing protein n=1 Tax=Microseira sp. BLCC-F43 TaxID=3153602 RepID=UPI0035B73FAF